MGVSRPGAPGRFVVEETDGDPSATVSKLKLPAGTLTDNGDGTATYAAATGVSTTHVRRTSDLASASGATTEVVMEEAVRDDEGLFDVGTGRIVAAEADAVYLVLANIQWGSVTPAAATRWMHYVTVNGASTAFVAISDRLQPAGTQQVRDTFAGIWHVAAADDYLSFFAFQNSGSSVNIQGTSTDKHTRITVMRLQ